MRLAATHLAATGLTAMALVLGTPALAQDAGEIAESGDGRVVELGADGPVVTDAKADTPQELTEQVEAEILEPSDPVIRDSETAVLEPLVFLEDKDAPATVEVATEIVGEVILPIATTNDLNARALEAMQGATPISEVAPEGEIVEAAEVVETVAEEAETAIEASAEAETPTDMLTEAVEAVAETETSMEMTEAVVEVAEDMAEDMPETEEGIAPAEITAAETADPVLEEDEEAESTETAIETIQEAVTEGEAEMNETPVTLEEEVTETATGDGPTVLRTRIVAIDTAGEETVTETVETLGDDAEIPEEITVAVAEARAEIQAAPAAESSVRVMMVRTGDSAEQVDIEAMGANVSDTVTADGTTRLIRIEPADGSGATLITITKESSKNDN